MKYLFLFAGLILSFSVWAQDTALKVYTGRYTFPAGNSITESMVEVKDGKLLVSSTLGSATLTRQQGDTFAVDEYGGQIAFLRSNEKVTGIKVNIPAASLDLEGVKADSTGSAAGEKMAAAGEQAPFTGKGAAFRENILNEREVPQNIFQPEVDRILPDYPGVAWQVMNRGK